MTPSPSASPVCLYQVQLTLAAGFWLGKYSEKGNCRPDTGLTRSSGLLSLPLYFLSCQLRTVAPWLLRTIRYRSVLMTKAGSDFCGVALAGSDAASTTAGPVGALAAVLVASAAAGEVVTAAVGPSLFPGGFGRGGIMLGRQKNT